MFALLAITQTECKQVWEVIGQIPKLFGCTCVCECPEAYRGGGDGSITGGGLSLRCINPQGGVNNCGTLCALQSIPGRAQQQRTAARLLLDLTRRGRDDDAPPPLDARRREGRALAPLLRCMRYSHSNDSVNNDGTAGFQVTRNQGALIGAASITSAQSCNWPPAHVPQTSTLAISGPAKSSRIWALLPAGAALD